ncbi:MAG TPA: GntR family transcriptional regulator [Candidatus Dorea intestinavium]|nr:GntR family transcriptional regulator [Candidatus Dorea intestinavium]
MVIEIDFNSTRAIYAQLIDQIILQIANGDIKEGDSLPSVRQLADLLGINMHTVNKAYSLLKKEGYISLDHRKGAMVSVNSNKEALLYEVRDSLSLIVAKGRCKNITKEDFIQIINELFEQYKE